MSVTRKKHVDMSKHITRTQSALLAEAAARVESRAVMDVPVDNGGLKSSIYKKQNSPVEWEVGADVDYAVYVEFGTSPHEINAPVFINRVGWRFIAMHPGTQAQPFLRPALDEVRKQLLPIWNKESQQGVVKR